MSVTMFLNLPVKDLRRSIDFFTAVGFSFNPDFTDDNAACMVISDDIYAMLLVEPFFTTFITKNIADTTTSTEMIAGIGVESRERVDALVDNALAAGGQQAGEPNDQGFMYGRSFFDPDGHLWEIFHMDLAAAGA